jgi:integrase
MRDRIGPVGFSKRRAGSSGVRWIALYKDARGRQRSAGTFDRKRDADAAWQSAEALQRSGKAGDPAARTLRLADYVDKQWFPNHVLEPTTRESYRYCLDRHIIPWFGTMKVREILPAHVREWVTDLIDRGVSPAQIRHLKIILSAVFTTALNDYVVLLHPCKGVKTPTVPVKEYRIVTPGEFESLMAQMPTVASGLLVETDIGSGARWGELTELRVRDLHQHTGILTISRSVMEVNPEHHPDDGRFLVKPYPKSKRSRRFKLDPELVNDLMGHIKDHHLAPDDLLFTFDMLLAPKARPRLVSVDSLGLTEPNEAGRQYQHATLSAYTGGKCRCPHCRAAFAAYRAKRRGEGQDAPRGTRPRDTDGHIPRDWFRFNVWYPACAAAGLDPRPRMHDLRHSHASWLLAGGADLEVVRERLGHQSIATTGKYVHTLPTADETALAALRRIRAKPQS